MKDNKIYCPLTKSENVIVLSKIDVTHIIEKWRTEHSLDISDEFKGIDHLCYCHSIEANFYFFYPLLTGSAFFYQKLQEKFEWYYKIEKWEFDKVLSILNKSDRVFELGCGEGNFLSKCNSIGCFTKGIEYNHDAVERAIKNGLDVQLVNIKDYVNKLENEKNFDVVCSFQVMEHVADPISILTDSMFLLKKGGKLIISVPNRISFLKYKFILFDHPPHHTCRWDINSLKNLKKIIGAKNIKIYYEPLAYDHIWEFVSAYKLKFSKYYLIKIIPQKLQMYIENVFIKFLINGGRKLFRGHTIIAVYNK